MYCSKLHIILNSKNILKPDLPSVQTFPFPTSYTITHERDGVGPPPPEVAGNAFGHPGYDMPVVCEYNHQMPKGTEGGKKASCPTLCDILL